MNMIIYSLNIFAILSMLIMTILMILIFREARPINYLSPLLSILICLQILFFFILLSGSRLNLWLSGFLLVTGSMIGFLRGIIITLQYKNGQVVGKLPLFFNIFWGFSLVLAQSLNMSGSVLMRSFGLMALIFMTGTQSGTSAGLFLRRLLFRKPKIRIPIS